MSLAVIRDFTIYAIIRDSGSHIIIRCFAIYIYIKKRKKWTVPKSLFTSAFWIYDLHPSSGGTKYVFANHQSKLKLEEKCRQILWLYNYITFIYNIIDYKNMILKKVKLP